MKKPRWSFALELLILGVFVYALLWGIGPDCCDIYLPPRDPCTYPLRVAKQKRTVADIRNIATATLEWIADVDAEHSLVQPPKDEAATEQSISPVLINTYRPISFEEIVTYLQPRDDFGYLPEVPSRDGWRNPYEFYFRGESIPPEGFLVRSAGAGGKFEANSYQEGPYEPKECQEDLVWMDRSFLRWPGTSKPEVTQDH